MARVAEGHGAELFHVGQRAANPQLRNCIVFRHGVPRDQRVLPALMLIIVSNFAKGGLKRKKKLIRSLPAQSGKNGAKALRLSDL
jgi:hypothetical protein